MQVNSKGIPRSVLALGAALSAPLILIALLSMLGILQNVYLSAFTGQPGPLWKVWIYELSSGITLLCLVPFVGWTLRRYPIRAPYLHALSGHLSASVVFSVTHVSGMITLRKLVFAAMGHSYTFGNALPGFAYEYGKDVFTYAVFIAVFALSAWARASFHSNSLEKLPQTSRGTTIKTPRGHVFAPFDAVRHVEACGNYVTMATDKGEFLHRATMKQMQETLPMKFFARTHRSHIVRLREVDAVITGRDGEKSVRLRGGKLVSLSRTYAESRDWTLPLQEG